MFAQGHKSSGESGAAIQSALLTDRRSAEGLINRHRVDHHHQLALINDWCRRRPTRRSQGPRFGSRRSGVQIPAPRLRSYSRCRSARVRIFFPSPLRPTGMGHTTWAFSRAQHDQRWTRKSIRSTDSFSWVCPLPALLTLRLVAQTSGQPFGLAVVPWQLIRPQRHPA